MGLTIPIAGDGPRRLRQQTAKQPLKWVRQFEEHGEPKAESRDIRSGGWRGREAGYNSCGMTGALPLSRFSGSETWWVKRLVPCLAAVAIYCPRFFLANEGSEGNGWRFLEVGRWAGLELRSNKLTNAAGANGSSLTRFVYAQIAGRPTRK
jgi:hypothetical protein